MQRIASFTFLKCCFVHLVALVLVLGPFLHGHLGASQVQGFHIDGLQVMSSPSVNAQMTGIGNDESPAVGVSSYLPKADDDWLHDLPAVVLLLVLPLLLLSVVAGGLATTKALISPVRHYAPGEPPPALAPPPLIH